MLLFTDRSIWTMVHGIVLGGAALMGLAAALFAMGTMRRAEGLGAATPSQSRPLAQLTMFIAAALWLGVIAGTYIVFPLYRATPPEGTTDLSQYPRFLIASNPETVWVHAFGMEIKEHMPWIASMLATAVAFVAGRYRSALVGDPQVRRMAMTLLAICFMLAAFAALMGIFAARVAPVE